MANLLRIHCPKCSLSITECISKLFGRVRHCFSHYTVGSSKTRQIMIRGLELNTTNHDMRPIGLNTFLSPDPVGFMDVHLLFFSLDRFSPTQPNVVVLLGD